MIFLFFVLFFGYKFYQAGESDNKRLLEHPCITDWKQCKNMDDLMQYSIIVSDAQVACTVYAETNLGYNNATWNEDWAYKKFSKYFPKAPFKKIGELVLEDDRALVPHSDGVDRRTPMICSYNLNERKVTNFRIPKLY
ncbi:hypothetical protein [Acetobacter sp.]|uniref:hypothetical protein n=1 Tax=Acetobacter sp. TaxID=440 RepID=UPI0039EB4D68